MTSRAGVEGSVPVAFSRGQWQRAGPASDTRRNEGAKRTTSTNLHLLATRTASPQSLAPAARETLLDYYTVSTCSIGVQHFVPSSVGVMLRLLVRVWTAALSQPVARDL